MRTTPYSTINNLVNPFAWVITPINHSLPLDQKPIKPPHSLQKRLLLRPHLHLTRQIHPHSKPMLRATIQADLIRLVPLDQHRLGRSPRRRIKQHIPIRSRNRHGPLDGRNLGRLQQARVRREPDVDAPAGGDGAERVAPAEAVPGRRDAGDAELLAQVGDGGGDDGVGHGGGVLREEGGRVEARHVDVAGGGDAGEEVRGDGQVTRAGVAVGEAEGG